MSKDKEGKVIPFKRKSQKTNDDLMFEVFTVFEQDMANRDRKRALKLWAINIIGLVIISAIVSYKMGV